MSEDQKNPRIEVRTETRGGLITSVIDLKNDIALIQRISSMAVDVQEAHMRQSLMSLGWTPPEDPKIEH